MTTPDALPLEPTPIRVSICVSWSPIGVTAITGARPRLPSTHTAKERVRAFKTSPQAEWFNHVNVKAHDHGGHFIPWENSDAWVSDLRRTFHGRRP